MITVIPYSSLGHADHGWLNARHHFSFANYYNPQRTGFGSLLVINDDIIEGGTGFGMHPHQDMEIITYVRKGAISHKDSLGNAGRTEAGDVQVMSAGTGIVHSEYNLEDEETNLYQIWILPNKKGVEPRWDQKEFPKNPVDNGFTRLASGTGDAPLYIHADADLYAGRLDAGKQITHRIERQAYVLVSEGTVDINGQSLTKGDGAEITAEDQISLAAKTDAEVLVLDVPSQAA